MSNLDVFDLFNRDYSREQLETMSLRDWLLAARDDKLLYASPAERMIAAIGEQELLDTAQDPRLGRIFFNRTIKRYKAFEGFYGMEDTIERIVGYFKHAAQGLEEKRQILYLLGPVGGGKSSLAERLKELMERRPIYVLKAGTQISPVFESPLGLFRSADLAALLEDKYGIERHRLTGVMSPWAVKRLDEFGGDISLCECGNGLFDDAHLSQGIVFHQNPRFSSTRIMRIFLWVYGVSNLNMTSFERRVPDSGPYTFFIRASSRGTTCSPRRCVASCRVGTIFFVLTTRMRLGDEKRMCGNWLPLYDATINSPVSARACTLPR